MKQYRCYIRIYIQSIKKFKAKIEDIIPYSKHQKTCFKTLATYSKNSEAYSNQ